MVVFRKVLFHRVLFHMVVFHKVVFQMVVGPLVLLRKMEDVSLVALVVVQRKEDEIP
jgi:hypothetical protein